MHKIIAACILLIGCNGNKKQSALIINSHYSKQLSNFEIKYHLKILEEENEYGGLTLKTFNSDSVMIFSFEVFKRSNKNIKKYLDDSKSLSCTSNPKASTVIKTRTLILFPSCGKNSLLTDNKDEKLIIKRFYDIW